MDSQDHIKHFKDIYNLLITFLEGANGAEEDDFKEMIKYINEIDLVHNDQKFHEFLFIISQIYQNHHRYPELIQRIERILFYFEKDIKRIFSNSEIFKIFSENPQILLLLLQKQIIFFDQDIIESELVNLKFFYPEIKNLIDEKKRKELEKELLEEDPDIFTNFDEKRRIGANNSYICTLIRNDSIVDFITFVNEKNISLSTTQIRPSLFETNTLLRMNTNTSLINYAAFFGSIQIFKYIQNNKVELEPSLWKYAIHSKNSEILMILEENKIKPEVYIYEESIKCHHNDIANYIDENYNKEFEIDEVLKNHIGVHYSNFSCIKSDSFNHQSAFFSFLNYQKYHPFLSNLYIKTKNIDQNNICNINYKNLREEDFICLGKFQATIYDLGNGKTFVSNDLYDQILNYVNFEDIFKIRHESLACPSYYNCNADKPGFIFDWFEHSLYYFFQKYYKRYYNSYVEMVTGHYIIILGIAIALNHIQSLGMIHYFLLPNLIYLDYELCPHVAGFGISSKIENLDEYYINNNLIFIPPEIKLYKNYDAFNQYSNVYTFAVLTYLLLPSNVYEKRSIIDNINYEIKKDNNYRFDFKRTDAELFNKFMRFCLQSDPENRKVTFKTILDTITDYSFYHGTYDFNIDTVLQYPNRFGNEFDYLKEKNNQTK